MSDQSDSDAAQESGEKSEAERKKELLRAKLKNLKDIRIPAPNAGKAPSLAPPAAPKPARPPIPTPVMPAASSEGLQELSASELIAEEEVAEPAGPAPMRFELSDLGVETPEDVDPTPSEAEYDEFEDEKTQMGTGLSFNSEGEFEDERTQLTDSPLDMLPLPNAPAAAPEPAEPASPASSLNEASDPHSFSLLSSSRPDFLSAELPQPIGSPELPQPIVGSPALPEPISSSAPLGSPALPAPIYGEAPAPAAEAADAEGSGEFSAQKTQLLDSPFENEPAVAKIRILAGPDTGQEFFVSGVRNTLGRGDANTIMLADAAMSRQHIEIVRNGDDTFTVRDLQSVNGTLLNGAKIREADLYHGDRVEIGGTSFQFLVHGNVSTPGRNRRIVPAAIATLSGGTAITDSANLTGQPQPQPAATSGMYKFLLAVGIALALVLAVGIGYVAMNKPSESSDNPEQASQLYLVGVDALKERRWADAKSKFEEAKGLDAQLAIGAQLKRIEREQKAQKTAEEAKKLYDEGEYDKVIVMLKDIPRESAYYDETRPMTRRTNVEADTLYTQAQDKVTREDFDGARELIETILKQNPKHQGAKDLAEKIRRTELENETERLTKENEEATRPIIVRKSDSKPKPKSSSKIINFTEGYRLYKNGKFDEAQRFFQKKAESSTGSGAKRAKKAAKDIKSFQAAYRAGKLAYAKREWSTATKKLTIAKRLDSAIAGGKGYYKKDLSSRLAGCKGNLGLQSLKAKGYARAYKLQRDGENYDKSNPVVKKLKSKLESEARNLYVKAANARKSNASAAAKYCRQVMSMVPSSNATHKKAQQLLKDL